MSADLILGVIFGGGMIAILIWIVYISARDSE